MHALARIVAEPDGSGGTRLPVLCGQSPLLVRRTGATRVHLVGGAAGPLGGDDLTVCVEVRAGAVLCVRTVAASLALPGHSAEPSRMRIEARVAAGAVLCWLPEPVIAAAGCDHHTESTVDVEDGGTVLWREELICGRAGESSGRAVQRISVCHAGRPLLRQELTVGTGAPGWDGPAVLGGARVTGQLLVLSPDWRDGGPPAARVLGPGAAQMPLVGPAILATATGTQAHQVRAHLKAVACRYRPRPPGR
jgi:urease accessory protein